jgi:dTDP-glucose 4,6-dehydratase
MLLVTGGAGFIGSNFVLGQAQRGIVNLDALTYAGNPTNLETLKNQVQHHFVHGSINDESLVTQLLEQHKPSAIVHFAAESHVDRSIKAPRDFMETNVLGTFTLLEAARHYWDRLEGVEKQNFRFLHVSTDEVYGSLSPSDPAFSETTPYAPNSPYSASKAASDHLVRAYFHTYELPVLTTNCSNNYGPYQFPEKLIPLILHNALNDKPLPIYGDGQQVRDWLYVDDHCDAIATVLDKGELGEVYNIGGNNEMANIDVVHHICALLDELRPRAAGTYDELIIYVTDRPGHDRRYAIDARKMKNQLGWSPRETFETGMRKTVEWYLNNSAWVEGVTSGAYREWIEGQYD